MARTTKKKRATASGVKMLEAEAPIVVPENIPEIYIDGFQGVIVKTGIIKLNFFSDVLNGASGHVDRKIVAYMTMSLPVLKSVHEAMERLIGSLTKDGIFEQTSDDSQESK